MGETSFIVELAEAQAVFFLAWLRRFGKNLLIAWVRRNISRFAYR